MKLIRKLQSGEGAQWPLIAFAFIALIIWLMYGAVGCVLNGPNLSPAG